MFNLPLLSELVNLSSTSIREHMLIIPASPFRSFHAFARFRAPLHSATDSTASTVADPYLCVTSEGCFPTAEHTHHTPYTLRRRLFECEVRASKAKCPAELAPMGDDADDAWRTPAAFCGAVVDAVAAARVVSNVTLRVLIELAPRIIPFDVV